LQKSFVSSSRKKYEILLIKENNALVDAYNNVLYKKGETVTLKKNSTVFNCTVKGVNIFGQLITESATETIIRCWRSTMGYITCAKEESADSFSYNLASSSNLFFMVTLF
jgi:biotin-(acetyl-CoA carboxylase) ligase